MTLKELSKEYFETAKILDEQINITKKNLDRARRKGLNIDSAKLHSDLTLLRNMKNECYATALYLKNYYVKGEK